VLHDTLEIVLLFSDWNFFERKMAKNGIAVDSVVFSSVILFDG